MKPESDNRITRASEVLARLGCPICVEMKEFQNYFLKNLRPFECTRVCNSHAWMIANSSPAESVATMFLSWVRNRKWRPAHPLPSECGICKRVKIEKEARLAEFRSEIDREDVAEWLRKHGMFCLRHGHELVEKSPAELRKRVEQSMNEMVIELEHELSGFLDRVGGGEHTGGGILGRAAEYLVANRGIES